MMNYLAVFRPRGKDGPRPDDGSDASVDVLYFHPSSWSTELQLKTVGLICGVKEFVRGAQSVAGDEEARVAAEEERGDIVEYCTTGSFAVACRVSRIDNVWIVLSLSRQNHEDIAQVVKAVRMFYEAFNMLYQEPSPINLSEFIVPRMQNLLQAARSQLEQNSICRRKDHERHNQQAVDLSCAALRYELSATDLVILQDACYTDTKDCYCFSTLPDEIVEILQQFILWPILSTIPIYDAQESPKTLNGGARWWNKERGLTETHRGWVDLEHIWRPFTSKDNSRHSRQSTAQQWTPCFLRSSHLHMGIYRHDDILLIAFLEHDVSKPTTNVLSSRLRDIQIQLLNSGKTNPLSSSSSTNKSADRVAIEGKHTVTNIQNEVSSILNELIENTNARGASFWSPSLNVNAGIANGEYWRYDNRNVREHDSDFSGIDDEYVG